MGGGLLAIGCAIGLCTTSHRGRLLAVVEKDLESLHSMLDTGDEPNEKLSGAE